jgi:BatD DUF11 like domain
MSARLARIFFFFAALCVGIAAHAAEVRAWLDRNAMQLGETVTLNVEVSGDSSATKPDFSALSPDFNLLGTQNSSSINIINGQTTSKLIWAVGLEPKHAGTLTVPALTVASATTQPITVTVQAATAGASGKAGDDLFIEVAATPHQLYVQQQMRLNVKLYYALNLTEGTLDEPQGDGLVVHKLGQDSNYIAEVEGRRYHVLERHYAIQPEKSGALALAAIGFRGRAINPNDFNSFFNRGRAVNARAEEIALDVRPRAAASGTDAWIPAQSVTLSEQGVDAATSAKVGEPITLTLSIKAQGQGYEQLPELKLPKIDGAEVYPDKEITRNRDDGAWLYGERERKFAIVPNRVGELSLPALSLAWWDVEHDRTASADVSAITLQVAPAAANVPNDARTSAPNVASIDQSAVVAPSQSPITASPVDSADAHFWRVLAFTVLAFWIATLLLLIGWILMQRRSQAIGADVSADILRRSSSAAATAFDRACAHADLAAASRALLAWTQSQRPAIRHLGELSGQLSDDKQSSLIGELMRALYGARSASSSSVELAERLRAAFRGGPKFRDERGPAASESVLPQLYPFRT